MELIFISVVLFAVLAFLAYPLFQSSRDEITTTDPLDTLIAERDAEYAAIRDLDFDFELGKLSADDHRALRERSKSRAAAILHKLDTLVAADSRAESDDATPAPSRVELHCANCGKPYAASDKFCARCGNPL